MSFPPSSSSSDRKVVIAIVVTFVITLMISVVLFFYYDKYGRRRWRNRIDTSFEREAVVTYEEIGEFGGRVKGLIVEENGRNVIYVKDLENRKLKAKFSNVLLNPSFEEEESTRTQIHKIQETKAEVTESDQQSLEIALFMQNPASPSSTCSTIKNVSAPPQLPPPATSPPPPPPLPPPAIITKRNSVPPPKAGGLVSSLRPPAAPRWNTNNKNGAMRSTETSSKGTSVGNTKLKPLHWDKVIANADHSMVWNEIIDGSLRFDDDEIEALFAYTIPNHKTSRANGISSSISSPNTASTTQTFILESRKSQNTAIVLKSLAVSRKEILDSLFEGHGLTTDVIEKLARIAPTPDEEAKILQFKGNPCRLADAESFLYYILKAVPSAFFRIDAMLFKSNYDAEILHLKESLQTLEMGCKELRRRGLFLKLLEAILKSGNRMNAGTSRGNAQGFNLTTLRKIADVKSNDGKTTLLHFVVEQVVRSEGRRRVFNQNRTFESDDCERHSGQNTLSETDREKEHILLGLQALRQLSIEFSNVKKAANVDYATFNNICSSLSARIAEIQLLITQCGDGEKGGFVREMKGFLDETENEIKVVAEEKTRILKLVKKTTDYYQAGAPKQDRTNLLQLFGIVKDFLDMVNQVCNDISQKMQKKNVAANIGSTSPPPLLPMRSQLKIQDFRIHLVSDSSSTPSSSESDDDF
ncbi:formin-like protein 4 [Mercurialis annua]|uniref:formin-like protein 4 n=1 Tax=Mercurialis annua TaxID=3986 RepID=UPI00215F1F03|nr:formin-like protein 4 [Mercurialis annua]